MPSNQGKERYKMIHEEIVNYLLRHASSTELDTILYALTRIDWDGFLRASLEELALAVGTNKKYMRTIMYRLTSPIKGRHVFVPTPTFEGTLYRLNLGKPGNLGFDKHVDRYSKKYDFFYTEAFRNLSLNAKRLILMGAFRMSVTKDETVSIAVNEIVPNVHKQVTLPFTKQRLIKAVNEINASEMSKYVTAGFGHHIVGREECATFVFSSGTLSQYKENAGELQYLRQALYTAGYKRLLSSEHAEEILKTAKSLYNYVLTTEKQQSRQLGTIVNAKDELIKLIRYAYTLSVKKLAVQLNTSKVRELAPKALSAYFSDIVFDTMLEESTKYEHQAASVKSLKEREHFHKEICEQQSGRTVGFVEVDNHLSPLKEKYALLTRIANVLKSWCAQWVTARYVNAQGEIGDDANASTSVENSTSSSKDAALNYMRKITGRIQERIEKLVDKVGLFGNMPARESVIKQLSVEMKASLTDYFAIHKNRVN